MRRLLTQWYGGLLAVTLLALLASCALIGPQPTATPGDESDVETRVAATLTALVATEPSPPPSATPLTPTPTEAAPLPTSTSTPEPPPTATPVEPPTPTNTPVPVITDWRGEYYDNSDLVGEPALVRNDLAVDFDWGMAAPAAGLPVDNFSARWTREVGLEAGTYRFHVFVDDGVRLFVDGKLLINAWYPSGAHEITVDYATVRGRHSVAVEYYEHFGKALVRLWWEAVAAPSYPDWKAEYWSNRDLTGPPALVRNDPKIDFYWGGQSPAYGVPADNFSARWTREVTFDAATYRFHLVADDGVRLFVDNQLLINAWYDSAAHELAVDQALGQGAHSLRVEYYEHAGDATVRLWWEKIAAPSYPDWKAEYWPNRDLGGRPILVRNDRAIDFDWGEYAPAHGLPTDNFSARWTRTAGFDGATYRFHVISDDGVRLWVDDQSIVDRWKDQSPREVTADHALTKGEHRLRVEYYEHTGNARIRLWWEKIAAPSYPDWKGRYWPNRDLRGTPQLVRNDQAIDFRWGKNGPAPGLPANNFSVRWTRNLDFEAGIYRFYARADDGIRFYIDGDLVISEWRDGGEDVVYSADRTMVGTHKLKVEYYEHAGEARVRFWWERIRSAPERK